MTGVAPARPARRRFSPLALFEALATPHGVDRYLELVNPMLTVRNLHAEITEVRRFTADTVTLTLRPTRQWRRFRAGQFVQVTVDIEGVRRTRCYSPACSQFRDDGRIELTIRAQPEGVVSQYLHANATPGLIVGLTQADGTFRIPDERPGKILLIRGGSGITPVLDAAHPVRRGLLRRCDVPALRLYEREVAYREDLIALAALHANVRLVLAYTDQEAGGDLHGFFGSEHLAAAAPWHADADTFPCGPAGLMKSVRALYDGRGLSRRLHPEEFAPAPLGAKGDASGSVRFERSDLVADNSGATLLEQAEAAGLTPAFGCRMGICFSCTKIKTSGYTRNICTGDTDVTLASKSSCASRFPSATSLSTSESLAIQGESHHCNCNRHPDDRAGRGTRP